jgi:hypothetical protein
MAYSIFGGVVQKCIAYQWHYFKKANMPKPQDASNKQQSQ